MSRPRCDHWTSVDVETNLSRRLHETRFRWASCSRRNLVWRSNSYRRANTTTLSRTWDGGASTKQSCCVWSWLASTTGSSIQVQSHRDLSGGSISSTRCPATQFSRLQIKVSMQIGDRIRWMLFLRSKTTEGYLLVMEFDRNFLVLIKLGWLVGRLYLLCQSLTTISML